MMKAYFVNILRAFGLLLIGSQLGYALDSTVSIRLFNNTDTAMAVVYQVDERVNGVYEEVSSETIDINPQSTVDGFRVTFDVSEAGRKNYRLTITSIEIGGDNRVAVERIINESSQLRAGKNLIQLKGSETQENTIEVRYGIID